MDSRYIKVKLYVTHCFFFSHVKCYLNVICIAREEIQHTLESLML